MKTTVFVSNKGQITLPSELRKKYGIEPGGLINIEDKAGTVTLSPAIAVNVRMYTDEEIARWSKEDEWGPGEREAWLKRIRQKKRNK